MYTVALARVAVPLALAAPPMLEAENEYRLVNDDDDDDVTLLSAM